MGTLEVIYEDNHVIAVVKPAGMLVQGDRTGDPTLMDLTRAWLKETHQKPGNVFLGLVHRLDRPVAGVVVFGKTSKGASRLSESIRSRQVTKTYRARVVGTPVPPKGTLEDWMVAGESPRVAREGDEGARHALSHYRTLVPGSHSLVEVDLVTGRKHQIRLQWAHRGYPLVGDTRYGGPPGPGVALIGWAMEFPHPTEDRRVRVCFPRTEEGGWAWD